MSDPEDDHQSLPALRPDADQPTTIVPTVAIPALAKPTTTGLFSRSRVDQDAAMLQSLAKRQAAATEFVAENGRTADAMRRTHEKVAVLHDLDAIRASARAAALDERDEAQHQRRLAALRREREIAEFQHAANAAKYGERVFRENEDELAAMRKETLKARERRAAYDAEANQLSAAALRNNAAAEHAYTELDLSSIGAPDPAAPEETRQPLMVAGELIDGLLRQARARDDQAAVRSLNNIAARFHAEAAYAVGAPLSFGVILDIVKDEITKGSARGEQSGLIVLYQLRDALHARSAE
jgi:hypothetical protein